LSPTGNSTGSGFHNKPLTIVAFSDTTQVSGDPTNGFTAVPSGTGVIAQIRERRHQHQGHLDELILLLVAFGSFLLPVVLQLAGSAMFSGGGGSNVSRLVLAHPAFSSYDLSSAPDRIETRASFTAPLVLPLVQDGIPVTLSIDSIKNDVVTFRAQIPEGS